MITESSELGSNLDETHGDTAEETSFSILDYGDDHLYEEAWLPRWKAWPRYVLLAVVVALAGTHVALKGKVEAAEAAVERSSESTAQMTRAFQLLSELQGDVTTAKCLQLPC